MYNFLLIWTKKICLSCIETGTGNEPHVTLGRRVQPGRHGSFGHRHAASHHVRSGRPPYLGSQVVTSVKVSKDAYESRLWWHKMMWMDVSFVQRR
jgi:hypothetical protein